MKSSLYFLSPIKMDIRVTASTAGSTMMSSNSSKSVAGPANDRKCDS